MRTQRSPSEAQIQQTCTELLELDGWRSLRTDPCSDRSRGKGFGEVGMADYLYIRYDGIDNVLAISEPVESCTDKCIDSLCQVLWVEWKKRGGTAGVHQAEWHRAERARGALTVIAGVDCEASIDGFWTWYRSSGLMRKEIQLQ